MNGTIVKHKKEKGYLILLYYFTILAAIICEFYNIMILWIGIVDELEQVHPTWNNSYLLNIF